MENTLKHRLICIISLTVHPIQISCFLSLIYLIDYSPISLRYGHVGAYIQFIGTLLPLSVSALLYKFSYYEKLRHIILLCCFSICLLVVELIFSSFNPALSFCAGNEICLDGLTCEEGKSERGLGLIYLIGMCSMLSCESYILAELIDIYRFFHLDKEKLKDDTKNTVKASDNRIDYKETQAISNNDITQLACHSENEDDLLAKKKPYGDNGTSVDPAENFTTALYGTTYRIAEKIRADKNLKPQITIRDIESEIITPDKCLNRLSKKESIEYSNSRFQEVPVYKSQNDELNIPFQKSEDEMWSMSGLKRFNEEIGYSISNSKVSEKDRLTRVHNSETYTESDIKIRGKERSLVKSEVISKALKTHSRKDLIIRDRIVKRQTRSDYNDVSHLKRSLLKSRVDKSHKSIEDSASFQYTQKVSAVLTQDDMEIMEKELTNLYFTDNKPKQNSEKRPVVEVYKQDNMDLTHLKLYKV